MNRSPLLRIILLLIVGLTGSCVDYSPPPRIVHADNYSATLNSDKRVLPEYAGLFTVDDAIRIGLANNPEYEQQKLAVTQAYNNYYQTIIQYLPTMNIGTNMGVSQAQAQSPAFTPGWDKTPWSHTGGLSASSSFTIFNGLRREFNLLQEMANVRMTEELQQNMRLLLVNSIIIAYYDIAQSREQIKITQADLKFQVQMRDFEMAKFQQNLVTEESVLNFDYLAQQDKSTILALDLNYKQQTYTLASLLGLTSADLPKDIKLMSISEIVETINIDFNPVGVEYYLDIAVDQRPDLKALRESLRMSKYELYGKWSAFAPVVTANAAYGWGTADWLHEGNRRGASAVNYGINTSWTIWDNGDRIFDLRDAQISYDMTYQQLLIGWIEIIQSVRFAYDSMQMTLENYKVVEKAVEIAQRQQKMVLALYETEMITLPRLNESQNNLFQSQFSLALATIAIYQAKANLEKACGISRY